MSFPKETTTRNTRNDVYGFVMRLITFGVDNTYLQIDGVLLRKKESLSTGERIATAAANIVREESIRPHMYSTLID